MPTAAKTETPGGLSARPILKWAGGKTQLLDEIRAAGPKKYGKYIEPFIGGGAVFFALAPEAGVIADSNFELISLYRTVAQKPEEVADALIAMKNEEDFFYAMRAQNFDNLDPVSAAARTIYLNKTCFNGLYRVNKQGQFNVPFGRYKSLNLPDVATLTAVAAVLSRTEIVHGDYKKVLLEHAASGDFVFLDPPYLPVGKYSDFKRYTKEQFYEDDHRELAAEVHRLTDLGAHVVLTNSNHPLVHELYSDFHIEVLSTKRHINSRGSGRTGQDVLVTALPTRRRKVVAVSEPAPTQLERFPSTRYMGSKRKLLNNIWALASNFEFDTAVDLFAGSNIVSYMFKTHGKRVVTNDYMAMSQQYALAMVQNNKVKLSEASVEMLLSDSLPNDGFVSRTFQGLYFSDEDNALIDRIRGNLAGMDNEIERAIATSALVRACTKKRARGVFTYVGLRYDDGRKDLITPLDQHFRNAVATINDAVFDNGKRNISHRGDALGLRATKGAMVYIDPPYYSPHSDNEYVRRYHFVEGIACNWEGVEIQEHTQTKKFKSYPTPFSSRAGAYSAFDALFRRFKDNYLMVSYSSNSLPTLDEIVELMSKYKSKVEVVPVDHRYSFGNQGHKVNDNKNSVQEYLFIGY